MILQTHIRNCPFGAYLTNYASDTPTLVVWIDR